MYLLCFSLSSALFCPSGWFQFDSACYLFSNEKRGWNCSRAACRKQSADLVMINSPAENRAVHTMAKKAGARGHVWIGLSKNHTNKTPWRWTDGSRPNFTNWGSGDPVYRAMAPDCVYMYVWYRVGKWDVRHCPNKLPFICERKGESMS